MSQGHGTHAMYFELSQSKSRSFINGQSKSELLYQQPQSDTVLELHMGFTMHREDRIKRWMSF